MINEFGAKNFYSFKDWAVINCRFDNKVPENIKNGQDTASVIGVKGANASGKTNVLKILVFIKNFVLNKSLETVKLQSEFEPTERINLTGFFESDAPSEFFIDFDYMGKNFFYEFSVTEHAVITEELSIRENKNKVKIFERDGNNLIKIQQKLSELKKIKLKKNVSLIHHIMNFEFSFDKNNFDEMTLFFTRFFTNLDEKGFVNDYTNSSHMIDSCSRWMNGNSMFHEFVVDTVKKFDLGISNIRIDEETDSHGEKKYIPYFKHDYENEEKYLPFHLESNGTKKLYTSLVEYFLALKTGGILILDEFDNYLHPMILPHLVEWFSDRTVNFKDAQFIFTSHNTEIMDMLGKYRTVLVEKKNNESICYRVDEISGVRNDRPLSDKYSKGQLGGVPEIG